MVNPGNAGMAKQVTREEAWRRISNTPLYKIETTRRGACICPYCEKNKNFKKVPKVSWETNPMTGHRVVTPSDALHLKK